MSIYRTSGKNTEIYEEYELYTREYVENVGGKSNFTAKEGTVYGDQPKTAKPLEITNLYVKVRLAGPYFGEFGFDWLDVNRETKEIEKIQHVPFSDIEYFYKKDSSNPLGGDIVEKNSDEIGAKHVIQDHYKFNPVSKHIDIPYVLIKPEQKITLSAEIMLWQGEITDDVIAITGDEFYDFEIVGGEKEGKTTKKKLIGAGKLDLNITCLKTGPEKTYDFNHSNSVTGSHVVGGLTMMENKVLTLKFRVIALVAKDGTESEKAKDLFRKFKTNEIASYLNKNSLNQAGYKIEIENEEMFNNLETMDVDDYSCAFNKEDWTNKNYFHIDKLKDKFEKTQIVNGVEKSTLINIRHDYIALEEYKQILNKKGKKIDNIGLIILSDYSTMEPDVGAFSRMDPLGHYMLFVYPSDTGRKTTYAHELGHMLGVSHSFLHKKEKKALEDAKKSIIGDGNQDKGIEKHILEIKEGKGTYWSMQNLIAVKKDMIDKMKAHDLKRQSYINEMETSKRAYKNYADSYYVKKEMTKKQYFELLEIRLKESTKAIEENKIAILELESRYGNKYENLGLVGNYLKQDLIFLLEQNKLYYKRIFDQICSNYVLFKQGSTKNMMDYNNTKVFFLHNQIKTMREDMQNYIDIVPQSK